MTTDALQHRMERCSACSLPRDRGHRVLTVSCELTARTFAGNEAQMSTAFPPCPFLPVPRAGLDWRTLHAFRGEARGADFYFACLEYGNAIWQRGFAARSLLCLDRAMGAELRGDEPVLHEWPMPYAAMGWLIAQTPEGVFLGNPRVHFQHYADRMNEPRREQRRWRAWACWAIARAVRPNLSADPKHQVHEPSHAEIATALTVHGYSGETAVWETVVATVARSPGKIQTLPGIARIGRV